MYETSFTTLTFMLFFGAGLIRAEPSIPEIAETCVNFTRVGWKIVKDLRVDSPKLVEMFVTEEAERPVRIFEDAEAKIRETLFRTLNSIRKIPSDELLPTPTRQLGVYLETVNDKYDIFKDYIKYRVDLADETFLDLAQAIVSDYGFSIQNVVEELNPLVLPNGKWSLLLNVLVEMLQVRFNVYMYIYNILKQRIAVF